MMLLTLHSGSKSESLQEKMPTSLIIRKCNQDHKSYHLTLVGMAIIKKPTSNKCCLGCGEKGTFVHCWWDYKLVPPLGKQYGDFLKI